MADLQFACRLIDARIGSGLIAGKASIDVKPESACGFVIDAGKMIPAAAFEELAGLDPDRFAARQTSFAMRVSCLRGTEDGG